MSTPVLPPDPDADAPEWWRRSTTFRRVPILVLIIVVAIFVAAQQRSAPPTLATNCHTPAFALSTYDAQEHEQVTYSMTGVPGRTYDLIATPISRDHADGPALIDTLTQTVTMPSDCTTSDTFGVLLGPGNYNVAMREPPGQRAVTATHKFIVTPRPS